MKHVQLPIASPSLITRTVLVGCDMVLDRFMSPMVSLFQAFNGFLINFTNPEIVSLAGPSIKA